MKLLTFLCLMLLALQSNGQQTKWTIKNGMMIRDSSTVSKYLYSDNPNWKLFISSNEPKLYAYLPNNSDTLIIIDTVWNFYDHIIRYIKIGNKVYPLKP